GFQDVFVQPAAYDGGTSLGAAAHVCHQVLGFPRSYVMEHASLGPEFDESSCMKAALDGGLEPTPLPEAELVERTAGALAEGKIVGWFQGRMEFGPRAL